MPEVAVYAPGTPMWVDLASADVEASKTFYTKLFGWQAFTIPDPAAGGYTMFSLNGKQVAAVGPVQMKEQPSAWSIYMATDDASATAEVVKQAGGKVIMEPMDVMSAGKMAVFQDPTGAYFSVWQSGDHKGAEVVGEPGAYAWTELNTRGFEKTKSFYKKVFGWGEKTSPMGEGQSYTEWQLGGKSIGGGWEMGKDMPSNIPPHWLSYFAVQDADAAAKKITELGGRVMMGPADAPGIRFVVATDPQGAAFGVLQNKA